MRRFYFPFQKILQNTLIIQNSRECHHIKNVLRLKAGDIIVLFNGAGAQAQGRIKSFEGGSVVVEIVSVEQKNILYPQVVLACAIPKKSKFETIIEKATELGVSEIIPLKTKRTIVQFKNEQMPAKIARFEKVALAAAKQCQRSDLPVIHPVMDFMAAVDWLVAGADVVIPSLQGSRKSLKNTCEALSQSRRLAFLIGPEGDFTDQEYAYAFEKKCIPATLGVQTLRVETAALACLSFASLYFHS